MASTGIVHVGDLNVRLRVEMQANVMLATDAYLMFRRPDGTEGAWPVTDIINGSEFLYVTNSLISDFDEEGTWRIQPKFTLGDWAGYGRVTRLPVKERILPVADYTDIVAPTRVSTDPANGTPGVATSKVIEIVFSESLDRSSLVAPDGRGAITVYNETDQVVDAYYLTFGSTSTVDDTVYLAPDTAWTLAKTYNILVPQSLRDLSGNTHAGSQTDFTT